MTARIPLGARVDRLCGDFVIYQPQDGQRYTTDDMLVAWLAVRELRDRGMQPGAFLDLGSGLCSVPMIVLWAFPMLRGIGMEISGERCRLGRQSLARNGLNARFSLLQGDIREVRLRRRFGLVTSSPPYYRQREGPLSPSTDKARVRFELQGSMDDYCSAAAAHLADGGLFATVYPFQYRTRAIDAALACGLSLERQVTVIPRYGKQPLISLLLFCGGGQGAAAAQELVIRGADHLLTAAFRRIRLDVGFPDKRT